jgi:hypothetical protein
LILPKLVKMIIPIDGVFDPILKDMAMATSQSSGAFPAFVATDARPKSRLIQSNLRSFAGNKARANVESCS